MLPSDNSYYSASHYTPHLSPMSLVLLRQWHNKYGLACLRLFQRFLSSLWQLLLLTGILVIIRIILIIHCHPQVSRGRMMSPSPNTQRWSSATEYTSCDINRWTDQPEASILTIDQSEDSILNYWPIRGPHSNYWPIRSARGVSMLRGLTPNMPTYTDALIKSSQRLRERSLSPPPAVQHEKWVLSSSS